MNNSRHLTFRKEAELAFELVMKRLLDWGDTKFVGGYYPESEHAYVVGFECNDERFMELKSMLMNRMGYELDEEGQ